MKLPFTIDQFFQVFKEYNLSTWPFQLFLYLLALLAILVSLNKLRKTDKIVSLILSFYWLWMGAIYHMIFFSDINKAAYIFGIAFILQGSLFLYFSFINKRISFHFNYNVYGVIGSLLMLFALLIYPLIGYYQGHIYPASPTFGLPCPTTIFTFGLLLWTDKKIPISLLIVPILWSIIGSSAVLSLGVKEDIGLLISAILFIILVIFKNKIRQ